MNNNFGTAPMIPEENSGSPTVTHETGASQLPVSVFNVAFLPHCHNEPLNIVLAANMLDAYIKWGTEYNELQKENGERIGWRIVHTGKPLASCWSAAFAAHLPKIAPDLQP